MQTLTLQTSLDLLTFDAETAALVGLAPLSDPERNLLASTPAQPAFVLQYLADGEYRVLNSLQADELTVTRQDTAADQSLLIRATGIAGLDLDVTLSVTASPTDRFSRWSATVRNGAGLQLSDLQYPFVVVPDEPTGAVLLPNAQGQLLSGALLSILAPDEPRQWQFWPENGNSQHYPGRSFAQFVAWCSAGTDRGPGVYMACDDTAGNVKLVRALRRPEGLRLGFAHVGDWPTGGERTLEYDVLLGSFTGDWYDAADLYREWTLQQAWATPLGSRSDIPDWLLESPPHITVRLQGYVDDGPAPLIEEFLPYEKCVPLLEDVAARVESPLVVVLMSWEAGGPWVYPECFPPVGGDESMAEFCRLARERAWHVGSFCNGTRWVTRHLFNGYDGTDYFREHNGQQGVCRQPSGELWAENWDQNWRPSYITCLGHPQTVQLARDFVRRLLGWGMESIQFFDQNCNASTFPCFSAEHNHPPLPGKWMAQAMADVMAEFRKAAVEAGETRVIHSTEWPTNEFCLPLFQQSDVRISAPSSGAADFVPLYHYLFHECTLMHGMMSLGPEPYAIEARTAWECVWGEMVGAVMTGDGSLLNRETWNWAEWEPRVGSNDNALEMMRVATALRRRAGRDFLVYGRMRRPAAVSVGEQKWEYDGRAHTVPAVAHCSWQAPDGRPGVALSNWTTELQTVAVQDPLLGETAMLHLYAEQEESREIRASGSQFTVTLPPLSCALLESCTKTARRS